MQIQPSILKTAFLLHKLYAKDSDLHTMTVFIDFSFWRGCYSYRELKSESVRSVIIDTR